VVFYFRETAAYEVFTCLEFRRVLFRSIVEGRADVDESMITGESRPVTRSADDRVVAGTVATDSSLRVAVTATGEETALAGIQRLVSDAQRSASRAQRIARRAAAARSWFAPGPAVPPARARTRVGA